VVMKDATDAMSQVIDARAGAVVILDAGIWTARLPNRRAGHDGGVRGRAFGSDCPDRPKRGVEGACDAKRGCRSAIGSGLPCLPCNAAITAPGAGRTRRERGPQQPSGPRHRGLALGSARLVVQKIWEVHMSQLCRAGLNRSELHRLPAVQENWRIAVLGYPTFWA
jgi:hypothetical protein